MVPAQFAGKLDDGPADSDRRHAITFLDPEKEAMRWNALLAAATLLAATSQPSSAQISIDMNQIRCGAWLEYSPENQDFIRFWMSGYYHAASNSNVLSFDAFQKNSAKIRAYCRQHRSQTLPTAIKNSGLWK